MLEEYGVTDMIEGVDFFVEEPVSLKMWGFPRSETTSLEFFFRKGRGELIGYMRTHIEISTRGSVAYIIDTTSASGFDYLSPELKAFYREHGYQREKVVRGFGRIEFSYVLAFIKENHPDIRIIPVAAYKNNEPAIWDLIDRVQKSTERLIDRISWGNEMHIATIFLQ